MRSSLPKLQHPLHQQGVSLQNQGVRGTAHVQLGREIVSRTPGQSLRQDVSGLQLKDPVNVARSAPCCLLALRLPCFEAVESVDQRRAECPCPDTAPMKPEVAGFVYSATHPPAPTTSRCDSIRRERQERWRLCPPLQVRRFSVLNQGLWGEDANNRKRSLHTRCSHCILPAALR